MQRPNSPMAEQMLHYIKEQPALWRRMLEEREPLVQMGREWAERGYRRVVMIGSGSSGFAAEIAAELLQVELGIPATVAVPTRIEVALQLADEHTLFLAISQSGKSTSTLQAVRDVTERGYSITAITADAESPVVRACGGHVLITCGEERVPAKTKGMTATLLTLYLLAMGFAEKTGQDFGDKLLESLRQSFQLAEENIQRSTGWVLQHAGQMARASHMNLVADGIGTLAARECALKLLECLYIPVAAHEFEEYLHGIQYTTDGNNHLFLLAGDNENRPRMRKLAGFHREQRGTAYIISHGSPTGEEGELFLATVGDRYALPFALLLPFQIIAATVSSVKGHDCDVPRFPDFYGRLDTKAQQV